jgi:hypothetical protein
LWREFEGWYGLYQISLDEKQRDEFIAFAELYGETNALLFDMSLPRADSSSFPIL